MKLRVSILLLGLIIGTSLAKAQSDFRSGYIIQLSGDTLLGEIDSRGDILMSRMCRFRLVGSKEFKKYSPNEILAYRFVDGKYYVSKRIGRRAIFLEYLIKGKLNVYYYRDDKGDHYFLQKEGEKLTSLPYKEEKKYVDGKEYFYQSSGHIGILSYYMKDAPNFKSRIKRIKEPEHNNLIKLAEDYHNTVCKDEKCLIYEKKQPKFQIDMEVLGGIKSYPTFDNTFYPDAGIIGHIWLPRANEKVYFKTGLLLSRVEIENKSRFSYKIPVHFEYLYPQGFIRPRVSYGLNIYTLGFMLASLDVGVNMKLNEALFVSLTSEFEFTSRILLIPEEFASYSLKIGVFIRPHLLKKK